MLHHAASTKPSADLELSACALLHQRVELNRELLLALVRLLHLLLPVLHLLLGPLVVGACSVHLVALLLNQATQVLQRLQAPTTGCSVYVVCSEDDACMAYLTSWLHVDMQRKLQFGQLSLNRMYFGALACNVPAAKGAFSTTAQKQPPPTA
jgi:hypothetical protein